MLLLKIYSYVYITDVLEKPRGILLLFHRVRPHCDYSPVTDVFSHSIAVNSRLATGTYIKACLLRQSYISSHPEGSMPHYYRDPRCCHRPCRHTSGLTVSGPFGLVHRHDRFSSWHKTDWLYAVLCHVHGTLLSISYGIHRICSPLQL